MLSPKPKLQLKLKPKQAESRHGGASDITNVLGPKAVLSPSLTVPHAALRQWDLPLSLIRAPRESVIGDSDITAFQQRDRSTAKRCFVAWGLNEALTASNSGIWRLVPYLCKA